MEGGAFPVAPIPRLTPCSPRCWPREGGRAGLLLLLLLGSTAPIRAFRNIFIGTVGR